MIGTCDGSENFVDTKVTYHIEVNGSPIVVENVPARVDRETGERLFSPQTVERLQHLVWKQSRPARVIETPVYQDD